MVTPTNDQRTTIATAYVAGVMGSMFNDGTLTSMIERMIARQQLPPIDVTTLTPYQRIVTAAQRVSIAAAIDDAAAWQADDSAFAEVREQFSQAMADLLDAVKALD